jgi:uncharacterized membrane protein YkoI
MLITKPLFADDFDKEELFALVELNGKIENTLSMQDAIKSALQHQPGVVKRARIELDDKQVLYDIEIASGPDVHSFQINPETGTFSSSNLDVGETLFNYITLGIRTTDMQSAEKMMANFILGIQSIKGTILDVEIEKEDGLVFYEVKSLLDNKFTVTLISAQTGESIFFKNLQSYDHDSHLSRRYGSRQHG